ncbi:MAG: rhomboid family intramembrane serine protease [Alphaproteobacteria bacterium]|nr:rhomboid family intramembrane serine protease [Alphaproteobacteria bacterium]
MIKLRGNKITWILAGSILLLNVALFIWSMVAGEAIIAPIYFRFGFVPAIFLAAPFAPFSLLSLVTYFFLHGGWLHMGLNAAMLLALGTGVERNLGAKWLVLTLIISSLFALLLHLVLYPQSAIPVIGASGGISGLLAVVLVTMMGQNNPKKIATLIALFIAISFVFGMLGGPNGENIAWVAHIGGFAGGLVVAFILYRLQHRGGHRRSSQKQNHAQASGVVLPFRKPDPDA